MLMLKLFHGRNDPAEQMDDWGFEGPIFGPMTYVHGTYNANLKFSLAGIGGPEDHMLWFHEDMVVYQGKYYGDWSVFDESLLTDDDRKLVQPFDRSHDGGY